MSSYLSAFSEFGLGRVAVTQPAHTADVEAEPELRTAKVDASRHGERLDIAVVALATEFSRNHLQALIRDGHVSVDGGEVRSPAQRVRAGQALSVRLVPTEQSLAYRAEPLPLMIVFEDDDILVVDKAPGMVVHPAAGNWSGTLLNGLLSHHPANAALPRAGIVHRLDKDTSGLMVVGKTLPAVTALVRAIAAREVGRRYLALANGHAPADRFTVEARRGGRGNPARTGPHGARTIRRRRIGLGRHADCSNGCREWRVPAGGGRGRIERLARGPAVAPRLVMLRCDAPDPA